MATPSFGLAPRRHPSATPAGGWSRSAAPARSRPIRWLLLVAAALGLGATGSWLAMRTVPWFGPLVADSLRAVLGGEHVTHLEEAVASVEDHVHHLENTRARTLSEASPEALLAPPDIERDEHDLTRRPANVTPPYPSVSTSEDGTWVPVALRTGGSGALYRTMLHPDPERPYAELFVFALDLERLEVHAVAGSVEPKGLGARAGRIRAGVIPESDRGSLVAAFNGGFKAEHGQYGMMVDGVELLPPKAGSCTVAASTDGSLLIAPWAELEHRGDDLVWWRQTPACMLDRGVLHPGLRSATAKGWGATLDGNTVIRRSAVGLSDDGHTLFVGISNSTTARALALGMQRLGTRTVAQLDVNFSFPRFLVYEEGAGGALTAVGAVKGLLYEPNEYVGRASTRDFFYVTAR